MSDIYCRFCAEPWEHDTLHEFNDYQQRGKLFALYGCNALMGDGESREPCATPCIDERVAEASAFLQDDSPHPEEWCGVYDILEIMVEERYDARAFHHRQCPRDDCLSSQGSTALSFLVCSCETITEHQTPRWLIVSRGSRVSSRYPRRAAHGARPRKGARFFCACITHSNRILLTHGRTSASAIVEIRL
jgi:hypothetical protein